MEHLTWKNVLLVNLTSPSLLLADAVIILIISYKIFEWLGYCSWWPDVCR
jgi:hypothetical protein